MQKSTTHTDQVALALRDRRRELGISRHELAAFADVSPATIARLEAGTRVTPANVARVASAMAAFEFYSGPQPSLENELVALVRVAS